MFFYFSISHMNIERIDLNLLVYLDVLLRERNVTRAAGCLGITQPAMSNSLRRLRKVFDDPLLVRTSEGMTPTERALNSSRWSAAYYRPLKKPFSQKHPLRQPVPPGFFGSWPATTLRRC